MREDNPYIERSPDKLVFASGEPVFNSVGSFWLLALAAILVITIFASAASTSSASFLPNNAGTFVLVLFLGYVLFRLNLSPVDRRNRPGHATLEDFAAIVRPMEEDHR